MLNNLMMDVGGIAWTVAFFLIAIAIIVAVHEFGHYIVARWCGIHAEVFSLGFGPKLFSHVDRRGTRWQLAAIPMGGFVRFLGDGDAASGKDVHTIARLGPEERRATLHGAPLWARAATVAAGPIFNFLLAVAVFAGMILWQGVAVDIPTVGKLHDYPFSGPTLRQGDQIIAVNGAATPDLGTFLDVSANLPPEASVTYRVMRAGVESDVKGPHPFPPIVGSVHPTSAAMQAGIQPKDVVLQVNGMAVQSFTEMPGLVESGGGKPVDLMIWRAGVERMITVTPERRDVPLADGGFQTRWLIGLSGGLLFDPELRRAGPLETLDLATSQSWYVATSSLSGMWHVATGTISRCNLSGPIGMAKVLGDAARSGAEMFLSMLAALSMGIGLLNLLPIPMLDGGHLMFYLWEGATGRPPSDRILHLLMTAGLLLVMAVMIFALSNDLSC